MCCRYYMMKCPELDYIVEKMNKSPLCKRFTEGISKQITTNGDVFPTNVVPVIASSRSKEKTVFPMAWGFKSKETGSLLINCRVESAASKQTWKESWANHRCIIPASWYFEWEHLSSENNNKRKGQKYMLRPKGNGIVNLAGVYRIEEISSLQIPVFAIITREASPVIREIHDRMPLILPESAADEWIMPDNDPERIIKQAVVDIEYQMAL